MFNLINKVRNRKGFTLVELLVVLAVLAIISAIAIPRFAGVQANAKKKADDETISMIEDALDLYIVSEEIAIPSTGTNDIITFTKSDTYATKEIKTGYLDVEINKYLDTAKIKLQYYKSVVFAVDSNGSVKGTTAQDK